MTKAVQPPPAANRSRILFGGAVAFILAAGLTAVLLSRGSNNHATATETAPIAITGTALPPFPDDPAVTDPARAMTFPVLAGNAPDGSAMSLPTAGRRTLVVAVAHWCPHCQREVPRLVQWASSGAVPADLDVVFLSTSIDPNAPNYPPSAWFTKESVPFPILVDDEKGSGHQALGRMGFPNLHLVGADGNVIARANGELEIDALQLFAAQT